MLKESEMYAADKIIDGLLSTDKPGHAWTYKEPFPWLEIELETEKMIPGIVLVNRMRQGNRLENLEVRVGNTPVPMEYKGLQLEENTVAGLYQGPGKDGETIEIKFSEPVRGKYISLQLIQTNYLHLEEVYLLGG